MLCYASSDIPHAFWTSKTNNLMLSPSLLNPLKHAQHTKTKS